MGWNELIKRNKTYLRSGSIGWPIDRQACMLSMGYYWSLQKNLISIVYCSELPALSTVVYNEFNIMIFRYLPYILNIPLSNLPIVWYAHIYIPPQKVRSKSLAEYLKIKTTNKQTNTQTHSRNKEYMLLNEIQYVKAHDLSGCWLSYRWATFTGFLILM